MKRFFSVPFLIFLLASMTGTARAQSCTASVCNAASANESDVQAALPSSGNTNATVVVNIPSGTASWTSNLNYTVPSGITSLTIQGATSIAWSGTAGTSSYTYSTTDSTIIQDSVANNSAIMSFTVNGNSLLRVTGLTVQGGSAGANNQKYSGVISFNGTSQSIRLDHSHLNNTTYSPALSSSWVRMNGSTNGVFDHNVVDLGDQTSVSNGFQAFAGYNDTIGMDDGTWASPTGFGTSIFLFLENNYFNGGAPDDCYQGGRFVMRYNTINNAYVGVQSHGTKSAGGPWRGCRAYEAYHNYFTGPGGAAESSASSGSKVGPTLIWGNTMAQGTSYRFWEAGTDRQTTDQTETNTPNGWGYCGTNVAGNGVGSTWDGNTNGGTGAPCLDGIGRGQTVQALNGQAFPSRLNSSTGTIAWPQQYLEPVYMWNNSIGTATYTAWHDDSVNNQDYYYDASAQGSGFNGTVGTGYGLLSARPSTCTAGPGGTYFTSPTGSYGVAYFATDANGGNGELYVCTSTNTWTSVYQPYTYPHPLVSGASTTTATPPAPTGLASTAY